MSIHLPKAAEGDQGSTAEITKRRRRRQQAQGEELRGAPLTDAEKREETAVLTNPTATVRESDEDDLLGDRDEKKQEETEQAGPFNLAEAVSEGISVGAAHGTGAAGLKELGRLLKGLRKYLTDDEVRGMAFERGVLEHFDVQAMISDLTIQASELLPLRDRPIAVRWHTRPRKQYGEFKGSFGGALSIKDRDLIQSERELRGEESDGPWFFVDLSLPIWLLSDQRQRAVMVFDALASCEVVTSDRDGTKRPRTKPPEVICHLATVGRFGLQNKRQGALVQAAREHPGTVEKLRAWGFDESGQGRLFEPLTVKTA